MDLTPENKQHIDAMNHRDLLRGWRFAASGNPWFQDETGKYWGERMAELRDKDPGQAVQDSKDIGWG